MNEKNWWFARGTQPVGPVTKDDLIAMIRRRDLLGSSLVWTPEMADWLPVSETDLASFIPPEPPPVEAPTVPPSAYPYPGMQRPVTGADALTEKKKINNVFAFILAISPVILFVVSLFLLPEDISDPKYLYFMFLTSLCTIVLWLLDLRMVRAAGYETRGWSFWGILLLPVYFYMRAKSTDKNLVFFTINVIIFTIFLFLNIMIAGFFVG